MCKRVRFQKVVAMALSLSILCGNFIVPVVLATDAEVDASVAVAASVQDVTQLDSAAEQSAESDLALADGTSSTVIEDTNTEKDTNLKDSDTSSKDVDNVDNDNLQKDTDGVNNNDLPTDTDNASGKDKHVGTDGADNEGVAEEKEDAAATVAPAAVASPVTKSVQSAPVAAPQVSVLSSSNTLPDYTLVISNESIANDAEMYVYVTQGDNGTVGGTVALTATSGSTFPMHSGYREFTATANEGWVFKGWTTWISFGSKGTTNRHNGGYYSYSKAHNVWSKAYDGTSATISANRLATWGEVAWNEIVYDMWANFNPTITATYDEATTNGTITYGNQGAQEVTFGGNSEVYTIAADAGYVISGVLVDGVSVAQPNVESYTYQFTGVKAPHQITFTTKAVEYTITYDLDGGSLADGVVNPTVYTPTSAAITLNNPTQLGYTFAGWQGTNLETPTVDVTIANGTVGNLSFTATWQYDQTQRLAVDATPYNGTYDAQAHGVAAAVTDEAGNAILEEVTLLYSADNGATWVEALTFTDAGDYNVLVKAECEGYIGAQTESTVTIAKAPITVSANDITITYGTAVEEIDPSKFTPVVTGDVYDVMNFTTSTTLTGVQNAGDYTAAMVVDAYDVAYDANYKITIMAADIIVEKAILTITANNKAINFGDAISGFRYLISGLVGDDTFTETVIYSSNASANDYPGTYRIIPSGVTELDNYTVKYVEGVLTICAITYPVVPTQPTPQPTVQPTPAQPAATATTVATATPVQPSPTPVVTPTQEPEQEDASTQIEDDKTPLASEDEDAKVQTEEVPLVATPTKAGWALLNLLSTVVAVAIGIVLVAGHFAKRTQQHGNQNQSNLALFAALPAIVAVVFFLMVSDLSSTMMLADRWTLVMALIAIVQICVVIKAYQNQKESDAENDF